MNLGITLGLMGVVSRRSSILSSDLCLEITLFHSYNIILCLTYYHNVQNYQKNIMATVHYVYKSTKPLLKKTHLTVIMTALT
jgi:hypothetical protein